MHCKQRHRFVEMLKVLVLQAAAPYQVRVYLYGSEAKGNTRRYSDIDIGLLSAEPLPLHFMNDLKEKIDNSTIPYHVDVVDLTQVDELFRQKVLSEGILWKD